MAFLAALPASTLFSAAGSVVSAGFGLATGIYQKNVADMNARIAEENAARAVARDTVSTCGASSMPSPRAERLFDPTDQMKAQVTSHFRQTKLSVKTASLTMTTVSGSLAEVRSDQTWEL